MENTIEINVFLDIKSGTNPVDTKVNASLFFLSIENGIATFFYSFSSMFVT